MEKELNKRVFVSMYKDLLDRVSDRLAWEIKQKGKPSEIVKGSKAIYIFNLNFRYVEVCLLPDGTVKFYDWKNEYELNELGEELFELADKICAM